MPPIRYVFLMCLVTKKSLHSTLFESVIPSELLSINHILELKGWVYIAQYNETLDRFQFTSYEINDKPYPLPSNKSVKKLRGKAVSNWGSHTGRMFKTASYRDVLGKSAS